MPAESPLADVVTRRERIQLGLAGVLALTSEILALTLADSHGWPVALPAIAAMGLGGRDMLVKGWRAVRKFSLGINFLMTLAVAGAIAIGEWPEAAMVTVLFAIAEKVEDYALATSRGAVKSLLKLSPDTALLRTSDGAWEEVATARIEEGQVIRIRPGSRVPLDGTVLEGTSEVDQSPITGESVPVGKSTGDEVYAGTMNQSGALDVEVTHARRDTTLARIIKTVQQAESRDGQTQRFVDRFARYYTPLVVIAAVLVAVVPPLFLGAAFTAWLYRALVLLVIACPCALVISTPVTVVSGLAAAARKGILIKGGIFLESGRELTVMAFDKTGTLTSGRLAVTDVLPVTEISETDALTLAAVLEENSEHSVARALVAERDRRGVSGSPGQIMDFKAIPGQGVRGRVQGRMVSIGNHRFAHDAGVCSPQLEEQLETLERQGKTAVVLFDESRPLALFGVADSLRPETRAALDAIRARGLHTVMLTGDNATTARAIAEQAGIVDVRADLLPEDKLTAIDALKREFARVGMVGDGINDAPALARADIGFAMGTAGTDVAIETADVALMKDDLGKLDQFLAISRRSTRLLAWNIGLALGIKAVFFVLAVFGLATLWMAVFADMGASLIVTFNGLRLLRG